MNSLAEQNMGLDEDSLEFQEISSSTMKRVNKRKLLRQTGKAYVTPRGKEVPKKEFVYTQCKCKLECQKLSIENCRSIHNSFWAQGNWQTQTAFIVNNINRVTVNRKTTSKEESRRMFTNQYCLDGKRVCLKTFLSTLGIAQKRVDYAIRNKQCHGLCTPDLRGSYKRTGIETSLIEVHNFLDSLPHYKTHYSDTNSLYFSPQLNKKTAYELYKSSASNTSSVGEKKFMSILKNYKVKFHTPRTDTCRRCDESRAKLSDATAEEREKLQFELGQHHAEAQAARSALSSMTLLSKMEEDLLVFSFDLEKTQPLPNITTSVAFYKRQLWLYNLGINTRNDNQGYMHVWLESEGRRGASEICSSLLKFLQNQNFDVIKKLHSFSDCCGGQNRNNIFVQFMLWFCNNFPVTEWQHSYLEPGHTFLPNDRDFAMIEKKKRQYGEIYSFDEWVKLIENSTKKNLLKFFQCVATSNYLKIYCVKNFQQKLTTVINLFGIN